VADSFVAAAERAAEAIDPMEDAQTSAEYRRDLARTVTAPRPWSGCFCD
jgi:CO/xanthine dehydrogenase FAD-binding subunit